MIRSAITVSLVPEAKGGPFVFWNGLEDACAKAADLGFDAIEIFVPSVEEIDAPGLRRLLDQYHLRVAAIGTGAGWVKHQLRLTDPNPDQRERAEGFIAAVIDFAASFEAPAIVGSMQGRCDAGVPREQAVAWLSEALEVLGERAQGEGVPLIYEPLNRYETNLFNSLSGTADFLGSLKTRNIKILADLFHMNIEEVSLPDAIRAAGSLIGHVHFADSNRRAAGFGHTDFAPVATALHEVGYSGYVSAEVLPLPNSEAAAAQTIRSFREFFPQR
jgi:sugar phosphate isomerase/epimerase